VWYSNKVVLNYGYDPIPRVSFRADDAPTGSLLEYPVFFRYQLTDSVRARCEAARRKRRFDIFATEGSMMEDRW